VSHPKAALTPIGRLILVRRIAQGRPAAHVAAEMGVSRATAYKWWRPYVHEGKSGLHRPECTTAAEAAANPDQSGTTD
jgi:transposase-like protein